MVLSLPNAMAVVLYIIPHVVVTPTIKSPLLLLHNCNFAAVMNCNVVSVFSGDLR